MEITHFTPYFFLLPLSFVNSLLTVAFLWAESLRNEQMEGWQSRSSNNDAGRQVVVINTCQKIAVNGGTIYRLSVIYIGDASIFVWLPVVDVESESNHLRFDICVKMFGTHLMLYPAWVTVSSTVKYAYYTWQLTLQGMNDTLLLNVSY